MMQSPKQIIGLSLLMSVLISISRCNDIINVGWVSSFQFTDFFPKTCVREWDSTDTALMIIGVDSHMKFHRFVGNFLRDWMFERRIKYTLIDFFSKAYIFISRSKNALSAVIFIFIKMHTNT